MITIEDNKRKFKTGDIVELIKDKIEFKKGSLFVVISNITMRGMDAVTVKSKLDNQYYWMYDNELKLYKSNDGKEILKNFSDDWGLYCLDRELNVDEALEKVMKDIKESNKKDSNDISTSSQVIDNLIKYYLGNSTEKKQDNAKENKNTESKFKSITISRGLFKGQKCEIISEGDKIYTVRLLNDDNFNIIKINKSDLYVQNEHEPEEGLYLDEYKYKIQGSKTILMDKGNNILVSTICHESDMFNKYRALEICRYKYLIKKYQKMIKSYQKELNILINE